VGFNLLELSRILGRPVALLRLTRGNLVERYTNADRAIDAGGFTYLPLAIDRGPIRDGAERGKSTLQITLPIDAPCVSWWRPYPPSTPVGVAWMAKHYGDDEVATEWSGRVVTPDFGDSLLTLNCEQGRTTARSRGLSLRWQRGCPLALYSQGVGMCNVDKALHAVPATLTGVDGLTLSAAEFGAVTTGRLAGGYVEWTRDDGEPERRSITAHDGSDVLIQYGSDTLAVDSEVTAYWGCKHTWDDCGEFDNQPNYGGSKYMPNRSPMDGNPV
jgi:hypothetical protein